MLPALPALVCGRLRHHAGAVFSRYLSSNSGQHDSSGSPLKIGNLNHVAIAVPDIEAAAARYRNIYGAEVSEPRPLPEHGVTVCFVHLPNTKIELLHPLGDASPIAKFLQRNPGGGIHHICLEVPDTAAAMDHVRSQGVRPLAEHPKIGSHGTPVAFLHPKDNDGVLVEFEQAGATPAEH